MKKMLLLAACAFVAFGTVGCDDEEDGEDGEGGSGGSTGGTGGGDTGGTGGGDTGGTGGGTGGVGGGAAVTCGDGTTAGTEKCDDGNTADGDACSADCLHKFISIAGTVKLNPIVERYNAGNELADPALGGLEIRIVDPIKSLSGSPDATLATGVSAADGTYSFASIETTTISLGIVVTIDDSAGDVLATSTMGVCQPGSVGLPDCSTNIAGFSAYVVTKEFVTALQASLNPDPAFYVEGDAGEGFVLGGVMDTNGAPVAGASVASPGLDIAFFDAALADTNEELTDSSTGAFAVKPEGIKTLAASKAGTTFVNTAATVGESKGVAFQVFFLVPAAPAACGDNIVNVGEGCDDGNTTSGDGCDQTCQIEILVVCGDGTTVAPELCDDGNTADGDACSADCLHKFVHAIGTVRVNPLAASIHAGTGAPLPNLEGLTLVAIEPIARLSNPGDPEAGIVGMTQSGPGGTFDFWFNVDSVPLGIIVTSQDGDAASTDRIVSSTMGICTAPCQVDLPAATLYVVSDVANAVLEASLAADLLSDQTGYILGMVLDVTSDVPAPMGGVNIDTTNVAADPIALDVDMGTGAFIDNGTNVTSPSTGAFLSRFDGIVGYSALATDYVWSPAEMQQGSAAAGVAFQMFWLGVDTTP